ncbi:hypothetical protein XENTR_v10019674 [Xenopus tropicalis]|uniref:Uncharacterized protein LOC779991 n=1 Tax=Xenopus tropicalis TaxID=8364 RepID=Q0P4K4_XENTR|eukprot:NP_001072536.1 uncharacterized protein LOC779991 [Xenopus tropicalis]
MAPLCVCLQMLHLLPMKIHNALKSEGPSNNLQIPLLMVALLFGSVLSNELTDKESEGGKTAWNREATSAPHPNSCRQYRFSTNGETLLNQHLSIKIKTSKEYCSFQMASPQQKPCTNSSHVTLINDTWLVLETTDLEYEILYLEYGAGKVGKSVEAIFAGFCQNKSENPIPTTANNSALWLVIGVIVATLIVIFILIVVFYRRRRSQFISLQHQPNENTNTKGTETGLEQVNEVLNSTEGNSQQCKHKSTEKTEAKEELEPLRDKRENTCKDEF